MPHLADLHKKLVPTPLLSGVADRLRFVWLGTPTPSDLSHATELTSKNLAS